MNITDKIENGINLVYLDGRFDANTSNIVEEFLKKLINEGSNKFVISMESVPYIASAGLRVVLATAKNLRQQHEGDLRLVALQPNVAKVFDISGLNNVLRLFEGAEEAVQSFSE